MPLTVLIVFLLWLVGYLFIYLLIYLDSLRWHWLIGSYRFQVNISMIHDLHIACPPKSNLPSPYVWPPHPLLPHSQPSLQQPPHRCLCLWVSVWVWTRVLHIVTLSHQWALSPSMARASWNNLGFIFVPKQLTPCLAHRKDSRMPAKE